MRTSKQLLFLLLLLLPFSLSANKIDSLKNILQTIDNKSSPKEFLKISLELGEFFYDKNNRNLNEALRYYEDALLIAQTHNYNSKYKLVYKVLIAAYLQGKYKRVIELGEDQLKSLHQDSIKRKGQIFHFLGAAKLHLGHIEEAYNNQLESLNIFQELNDSLAIIQSSYELGRVFYTQKQYDQARINWQNTLRKSQLFGHKRYIKNSLIALAAVEEKKGNLLEAIKINKLILKEETQPKSISWLLFGLGNNYSKLDSLDEAEHYYLQSKMINKKIGDLNLESSILNCLSNIYILKGNYNKALVNLDTSFQIANKNGIVTVLEDVYKLYADVHYHKNNIKKYKQYTDLYQGTKDSLYNKEIVEKISTLEKNYEIQQLQKEQEIVLIKKEQEIQSMKLNTQIWIGLGFLIFITIISIILYSKQKNEKAKNKLLAEKNQEVKRQYDMLLTSNQDLEKFARIISHDLKEPLRNISGFTSLLKRKLEQKFTLDDNMKEYMGFISKGTQQMSKLLQGILEYSKLNTKENKVIEKIDTNELVNKVVGNLNHLAKETQTYFAIDKLPQVQYNQTQLYQIFLNLFSNAIHFRSDASPKIEVYYEENEEEFLFFIKDNGIGITPEYFEKVFVAFQRLNNRSRYTGSGLGLSTCKKIIEANGGNIKIYSSGEEGTIFCFSILKVHSELKPNLIQQEVVLEA